ncbi:MAG: type II secretion system protein GspG [Gemmatimonadales bacterium]|nr:type II secretion system protein GspG [Gemmatimonadales bacterium]
MSRHNQTDGFTLIEIVIAAAIVAIMAGTLIPVVFNRVNSARSEDTSQEQKKIQTALLNFYQDMNRFPTEDEGLSVLVTNPGGPDWEGPYFTDDKLDPLTAVNNDAFGNPYVYELDPVTDPGDVAEVVVASAGSDRTHSMPDGSSTWVLADAATNDDLVFFVSSSMLNRDKRLDTISELDDLASAVRNCYRVGGSFPADLDDLTGVYIDSGFENNALVDDWGSSYSGRVHPSDATVYQIWSHGLDQQDDTGEDDDLLVEIDSSSIVVAEEDDPLDVEDSTDTAIKEDDVAFTLDLVSTSDTDLVIESFEMDSDITSKKICLFQFNTNTIWESGPGVAVPTGVLALNAGTTSERTIPAGSSYTLFGEFKNKVQTEQQITLVLHFTDGRSSTLVFTIFW